MASLAAGMGVAQLFAYVGNLILKIEQAVDTARQNKEEWMELVDRLSVLRHTLPTLPQDQELARPLNQLYSTLLKADELVLACQEQGFIKKHFEAHRYADMFIHVKASIMLDIGIFQVASNAAIIRRLDKNILLPVQQDSGKMAQGSSSSGSGKTQKVVSHVSSVPDDQPRGFTWAEIAAATNNLTDVLGEGLSGTVYRGHLRHHGRKVAVKMLKHGRQGKEVAFVMELEILFPIRHDNIVRLLGWCAEEERRMFVYEHMSNGTLRDHLRDCVGGSPVVSSWRTRFEVLLGAASALQHLHGHPTRPMIHRNVSSSNILLDENWTPRLCDFGQALLIPAGLEHGGQGQLVPLAIGTFGYIDPEYDDTRRVSPASDVYSFGVVILEVLTGRLHKHMLGEVPVTLVSSVLPVIQTGRLLDVLDGHPALPTPTQWQMEALKIVAQTAERCLCPKGKDRLAMFDVVANLKKAHGIILSDEANLFCVSPSKKKNLFCVIRGDA